MLSKTLLPVVAPAASPTRNMHHTNAAICSSSPDCNRVSHSSSPRQPNLWKQPLQPQLGHEPKNIQCSFHRGGWTPIMCRQRQATCCSLKSLLSQAVRGVFAPLRRVRRSGQRAPVAGPPPLSRHLPGKGLQHQLHFWEEKILTSASIPTASFQVVNQSLTKKARPSGSIKIASSRFKCFSKTGSTCCAVLPLPSMICEHCYNPMPYRTPKDKVHRWVQKTTPPSQAWAQPEDDDCGPKMREF